MGRGKPFEKGNVSWNTGKHHSEETKYKIGSANRGKKFSVEIRKAMSDAHLGQNTWSKGRPLTEEHKRKIGEAQEGRPGTPHTEETKMKLSEVLKGRKLSDEMKKKISLGHKGLKLSPETCRKISETHKGMAYSDKTKKKISKSLKKLWREDPEHARKCLVINSPNKQEIKLMGILDSMYPGEWKFVGDGQVMIAGKCPDFINVNGHKKIIELYGEYWHQGDDPRDREAIFAPLGYKTLVIWQKELKHIKTVKNKIKKFGITRLDSTVIGMSEDDIKFATSAA